MTTLSALVAILASARHGNRRVAWEAFVAVAPTATERAWVCSHVRALDPAAADVLLSLCAERVA